MDAQAQPPLIKQEGGALAPELFDLVVPSVVHKPHVGIRFPNGAKCVVVEDAACHMASAAVTMRVGMNQDPPEVPGLAHFCEHMLFMGTTKYPSEDAFDQFVSKHGGHTNAWTEYQGTTYYFTTSDGVFLDALDRFLEFFVAPSFSPDAIERELEAVHSEDEKNHSVDYWRLDELTRGLVDPRHPYSRYGNGNLTTLRDVPLAKGIDVREQLLAFYDAYYVGEATSIVLYSRHSVAEVLPMLQSQLMRMRAQASPAVNSFISRNIGAAATTTALAEGSVPSACEAYCGPFLPSSMRRVYCVVTKKQVRSVRLCFPYPDPAHQRNALVSGYASHIIGHECSTSILGVLKARGWATDLSAGGGQHRDDDDGTFQISVELTQSGFQRFPEVVAVVFRGVQLLVHGREGEEGGNVAAGQAAAASVAAPPTESFVQMLAEDRLQFEMSELDQTEMHCAQLSSALHTAHALPDAWLETVVATAPDYAASVALARRYLVPENCIVFLLWNGFPLSRSSTSLVAEEEEEEDEEMEVGAAEDESAVTTSADAQGTAGAAQNDTALVDSLPPFIQTVVNVNDAAAADHIQTTQFHSTVYASAAIPDDVMTMWHRARFEDPPSLDGLAFPPQNRFLATDFTVFCDAGSDGETQPTLSSSNDGRRMPVTVEGRFGTMHVALASTLRVPKVAVDLDVTALTAYATPLHRFFTRVMVSVLKHNLTEVSYMGELASIVNEVVPLPGGVGLRLDGPSHRMAEFLMAVVVQSVDATVLKGTAALFETYRDVAIRKIRGAQSRQPSETCVDRLYALLVEKHYVFEDILNAATAHEGSGGSPADQHDGPSYRRYCLFVDEYLQEMRYSLVVAGNVASLEAATAQYMAPIDAALAARIRCVLPKTAMDALPYLTTLLIPPTVPTDPAAAHTRVLVLELPAFCNTEANAATVLELQLGVESPSLRVHADCFMKLVASAFFNALRTRETLGYVVYCRSSKLNSIVTLRFVAQSAKAGVDGLYLLSRIFAFLDAVQAAWPSLCTSQAVQDVVTAQQRLRQEPLKSIRELATEISQDAMNPAGFERRARELECLRSGDVSVDTLSALLRTSIANDAPLRRAVAVVVQAPQYNALVAARRAAPAPTVTAPTNLQYPNPEVGYVCQSWALPPKLAGGEASAATAAPEIDVAAVADADENTGGAMEDPPEQRLSLPSFDDGRAVAELCLVASFSAFKAAAAHTTWTRVLHR